MILYFSGSGNSLAVARRIAEKTGERTMPLREATGKDLMSEKRIGLVFPTYWLDAPTAVRDLVPQLQIAPTAYVFIVITCGAQTNNAIWTVRRLLRKKGVKVAYCNKIRVPDSSAIGFGRNPNDHAWKFERYAPRLEKIIDDIAVGTCALHFSGFDPFGWLLNRPVIAAKTQKMTRPVCNTAICVGCGICEKVCPQRNITIVGDKAKVGDRCTMCLACVHFCPHQAMEIGGKPTKKEHQYHHPEVKLKDMIWTMSTQE